MTFAIDCRMQGKSGIGTFLAQILPYITQNNSCLLIGQKATLLPYAQNPKTQIIECNIRPFSIKEMLFFPKKTAKKINSYSAYFSPYCNIPCGIKVPIFCTIHDVVFLDVKGLCSKIGAVLRYFIYKRATKKSKAIFTVSEFSKQRIIKHLKPKAKIIVLPNGIAQGLKDFCLKTPAAISPATDFATQQWPFILFVGNIKKHKGLFTLLVAYKMFLDLAKQKNITPLPNLKIVGQKDNFRTKDTQTQKLLQDLQQPPQSSTNIQDKEQGGKIIFTGYISDNDLYLLYKTACFLVQPSFYEGFGLPPIESLFCNTPVILSDIQVFKEIYGNAPVTFFDVKSPKDLSCKMLDLYTKILNKCSFDVAKQAAPLFEKYNYQKAAKQIIQTMCL